MSEAGETNFVVDFDAVACQSLPQAETREWLVTNGIGGYAAGTVAGIATRRYHGYLIAALNPPVERTLLLARLEETVEIDERVYPLFANRWLDGTLEPRGFKQIERFYLDQDIPTWIFTCGTARLEKKVWMQPGANTTYVTYRHLQGTQPLNLVIQVLTNQRDHHLETRQDARQVEIETLPQGLRLTYPGAAPFYLFHDRGQVWPEQTWQPDYFYAVEAYRGLPAADDHLLSGIVSATLQPGESLTLVASTQAEPLLDGAAALAQRRQYQAGLLAEPDLQAAPDWIRQLLLAADQFIVRRALPDDPDGRSVIAGYPWFSDWGRDTMIALPGLTLVTRRYEVGAKILRTFGHYVSQGMLPNRFPDEGGTAEYNTVDATLWYFEALRAYHAATGDLDLIREIFPTLQSIITWHRRGTRYQIKMDPADGLIYAGEPGVQLTWMDAKVGDWVVTPRIGKPVEINALWYNALQVMVSFGQVLGEPVAEYTALAGQVAASFDRFWNAELDCCFDLLDGPQGSDPALRPNQLFAVALPHSPFDQARQQAVVRACQRELQVALGLRSLSARDPAFIGSYGGDQHTRDAAYHQGTVWSWLIGPFVSAHLRAFQDPDQALTYLQPFRAHLLEHGLGTISEVFEGAPPHTPRGCFAQAWGVAEVLRVWDEIRRKNP